MSEYQYYGFQAIDRTLSQDDTQWLRGLSTRAQITATSFVNVYNWGDFRGDPIKLMERCFDVFVYVANWGYRRFIVRLPRTSFDAARAKQYCAGDCVSLRQKKDCVLLEFSRDDEPGEWEGWDEGSGWIASLTPLRGDVLDGDWRCLYLAWLTGIEGNSLHGGNREPPVPAGMKDLSAPLRALVDFLGIDTELIGVASERTTARSTEEPSAGEFNKWIRSLAGTEKDELLLRIAQNDEPNPRRSLIRRFKEAAQSNNAKSDDRESQVRRTVAQLTEAWKQRLETKRHRLAKQTEQECARRARAEAQARKRHLEDTVLRADVIWRQASLWIAKRSPKGYDRAVDLLSDLRDAAVMANRSDEFGRRLQDLRESHSGKPSLIRRLEQAGLAG